MSYSLKLPKALLLTTALIATSYSPAFADVKDDKIAAMEQQMMVMMQEIKAMKAERTAEKAAQDTLKQQVSALETKTDEAVANIAPAAGVSLGDGVEISMKGSTPKITKGEVSFQPTGRMHLDAGGFDDDAVDHPNGAEFRRARIGMKGKVSKDFGYKLEADFANEGVNLTDAYLNYSGLDKTDIRVGHFKPGYSLEETMSSNDISFIERSAAVDSFTSSRKLGLGVLHHDKNWTLAAGVFNDDAGRESDDDEALSVNGRFTVAPIIDDNKIVHLGASASYREPDQSNDTFDFDARADNRLQRSDSIAAVMTDVEHAQVYGIEAAASIGSVHAQGEYLIADVDNRAGNDPSFSGGYGQVAWFATGEQRPYSAKKGAFSAPKINRPLNPSKGDWGAVELAARYSHLDLNDGGITGGELTTTTLGANWYVNNNVRFMGNVIFADTDENAVTPNDDPTVYIMRSQVKF